MSVPQTYQDAVRVLAKQEDKFFELAKEANSEVVYKQEFLYACQAMMKNDYLCSTAVQNPLSLRNAFAQVAACGLTLNPARGLCYLVPREGQVVLDVSYRGMIQTAVTDGAIRDCIVELVYSNDMFKYKGKRTSPEHEFDPFALKEDRGEFRGVYVEVTLPDGRVLVEAVTRADIEKARDSSDLWKRKKKGPWLDHEDSMRKKSGIKISKKYWPMVSAKLDQVIHYLNTDAGEGFASDAVPVDVISRHVGLTEAENTPEELPTSNGEGPVVSEQTSEQSQVSPEAVPKGTDKGDSRPEGKPSQTEQQAQRANPAPKQAAAAEQQSSATQGATYTPPPKTVRKTQEVVKRALASGSWQAAREYLQDWPADARDYALRELSKAQYEAQSRGE